MDELQHFELARKYQDRQVVQILKRDVPEHEKLNDDGPVKSEIEADVEDANEQSMTSCCIVEHLMKPLNRNEE